MAKYRVIIVGFLLKNNEMAYAHDIVDDEQLPRPAKNMIDDKYIVSLKASELKALEAENEKKALEAENKKNTFVNPVKSKDPDSEEEEE